MVAAPGKRWRGPDEGLTPGKAVAAAIAIAVGAYSKEGVPLGQVIATEISSASGVMVQDVAREPYIYGGHEYKLLSNLGPESGEEREARLDLEQLAMNGSRLTLGMVRALAEEIPGPTDGDSGDEKVGLLVDSKVGECVEERSPLSNSSGVEVGKPLPQKVRPIEKAREARARRRSRLTLGIVRALAEEIPGPTDGDSGDEKVGLLVDSKVGECVEERRPLSNSPGVEVGKPEGPSDRESPGSACQAPASSGIGRG